MAVYISFPGYLFNTHLDVVVICAYIPPENSTFYSHEDEDSGINMLCDEISDIQESNGEFYLILTGDLNVRTGCLQDFIMDDSIKHLPVDDWYEEDNFPPIL